MKVWWYILMVATLGACAEASDPDLVRLDGVIARHGELIVHREAAIDSVRYAHHSSVYEHEMAMQDAMGSFSLDSAITHAHRAIDAASTSGELAAAQLALVRHYNTSGVMYKEASEVFGNIDRTAIDEAGLRFDYYSVAIQLNRNLSAHPLDRTLRAHYLKEKVVYRDSALMLDPSNAVLLANRYIDAGDYLPAIDMIKNLLGDENHFSRDNAILYNVLSTLYIEQGDRANARKYLALSATADLTSGVREYLSLQQLAMMLYEDGDYERAYRYINQSINDATACNAKLRMLEMATMLPIIQQAHEKAQRNASRLLMLFMVLIGLMAIVLGISVNIIRRRNRSLHAANERGHALNARLAESDCIKEEYVTQFMNLCLEYLAQMEGYRRELLRIAAHRNFDELCKAIKSERYIGSGINDFYEKFDEAFLNMFPTFVKELQQLLDPTYQLQLKDNRHLNTELRILALMRLGFTDSDSISKFLRCSASTIYNYRTRLRNAALDRGTFDAAILTLGGN